VKVLLIVGKGPCWREGVEKFRAFGVPHDVMGVNHAALWLDEPPKYAFSYHPDIMDEVKTKRPGIETVCTSPSGGVDKYVRIRGDKGGSSAFLAARVGLEILEYDRCVLAGVPLSGDYFTVFVPQWISARNRVYGRCKSMSGATKALLGEPTIEWMTEGE
jgi:hypothetical protein